MEKMDQRQRLLLIVALSFGFMMLLQLIFGKEPEAVSSLTGADVAASTDYTGSALLGGKEDGSFAWIIYGGTRSIWHKEKFAKTFPGEKEYRHSLAEEADALRSVITLATSDKKTKKLSPSLKQLQQLDNEGLLEAYILLARPDDGIALDYPSYLKANREKLHRYVALHVIGQSAKP